MYNIFYIHIIILYKYYELFIQMYSNNILFSIAEFGIIDRNLLKKFKVIMDYKNQNLLTIQDTTETKPEIFILPPLNW